MKVYNLIEITDSRIQYDKKPPAFMRYIVLIVLSLICIGVVWANKSVKTYIVKGQGRVVSEDKSYIMSKSSGEISEVLIKEGSVVKAGDVLFSTSSTETVLQLEQINAQIDTYSKRIELLKKAEKNATNNTNSFNKNNSTEVEFYNKLQEAYTSRKEYNIDEKVLKEQGYEQAQIEDYKKTQNNKKTEHYYKTISTFTDERNQYEIELSKLKSQKQSLEKSQEQYIVTATKDGIIHLDNTLKVGMVIQAGSVVGSISGNQDLIIETMLNSTDRPRIHVDDDVSLVIGGLNQSEYGTIPGKVASIDEDATIDTENNVSYFKVKVIPEKTYLEDSKGERVNLTVGMVSETRVKYEKITYMNYFLELVGVKLK